MSLLVLQAYLRLIQFDLSGPRKLSGAVQQSACLPESEIAGRGRLDRTSLCSG